MKTLKLFSLLVLSIFLFMTTACEDDPLPSCDCVVDGNPDFYASAYVHPNDGSVNVLPQINVYYDNIYGSVICGICAYDIVFTDMTICEEIVYSGLDRSELTDTFAVGCMSTYKVEIKVSGGDVIATMCDVIASNGPACRGNY